MIKINWKTEKRKVKDLIPADYNPRKISEKQRGELMESIKEFSEVEPVVINTNNRLIGGHQRISIYADLGKEEIDVRVPNRKLTEEEEKRLNLRLNKNTGDWDLELLGKFDMDMLLDVGFDEELSDIFDDMNELDGPGPLDNDRIKALTVLPPETPVIKERAQIGIKAIDNYEKIKKAVEDGVITEEKILALI